jgi:hypothetical protein
MFKGTKPAGQPRTIRSIAEERNNASNFTNDKPEAAPVYEDKADKIRSTSHGTSGGAVDPSPFKNLR